MDFKVKTIDIFEALHNERMHPTQSNFVPYWNRVEEYILNSAGFNRGTASQTSILQVSQAARAFYKGILAIMHIMILFV